MYTQQCDLMIRTCALTNRYELSLRMWLYEYKFELNQKSTSWSSQWNGTHVKLLLIHICVYCTIVYTTQRQQLYHHHRRWQKFMHVTWKYKRFDFIFYISFCTSPRHQTYVCTTQTCVCIYWILHVYALHAIRIYTSHTVVLNFIFYKHKKTKLLFQNTNRRIWTWIAKITIWRWVYELTRYMYQMNSSGKHVEKTHNYSTTINWMKKKKTN